LSLLLAAALLAACSPPSPAVDIGTQLTQAVATAFASMQQTQAAANPPASETPVPTPTAVRIPPALPPVFQAATLDPLATPHTYVADSCQYLKDKWNPNNAAPGTIVVIVMFHTIEKGTQTASDPKNVGSGDFIRLMKGLHDMGFQAIAATQLADFLDSNTRIPPRSVVLIQDDRHAASNFNDWFRPYWQDWGWPVINGWISALGGGDPVLAENVALEQEGWVDHQAHGVVHNINMSDSSTDEFLLGELQGSQDAIQQYYGKKPIAIIWPGGGFGVRPVQIARQLGYRLGFTVNPRGPVMYNWVPLADRATGSYDIAEGPVNDPRMTLPRYWPSQVIGNLDAVRVTGEAAAAYAEQNRAVELEYYDIACAPTYGAIPAAVP
jgi:hypothetical protein